MKILSAIKPLGSTPFRGGGFPGSISSSKRRAQNLAVLKIAAVLTGCAFVLAVWAIGKTFYEDSLA